MPRSRAARNLLSLLLLAITLACSSGCLVTHVKWREPDYVAARGPNLFGLTGPPTLAEHLYAKAIDAEKRGCDTCVDLYFRCACVTAGHGSCCQRCGDVCLHKSALTKLVVTGQRFCRLDPRSGLSVGREGQQRVIPVTHHGFVWQPHQFCKLIPVGNYKTNAIDRPRRMSGAGIPLVVAVDQTDPESFLDEQPMFAATLKLSPGRDADSCSTNEMASTSDCELRLYDPLRVNHFAETTEPECLAHDLSAPFIYRLRDETRLFLEGFINPRSERSRLYTLEPYQPGKIPVVFVHGLLSDPFTWIDMINDLQRTPGFVDHFQVWLFEYPTGRSFLASAARLREQLRCACEHFDPGDRDPQLSNLVLVGHSMGGLVSKLQIMSSGDQLWRAVANRPVDQVRMDPAFRQQVVESFFFEPSRRITRVVFIGTPHHGANEASRLIGRVSSALVTMPDDIERAHEEMIRCNPGVFSEEVSDRIPTSIDLLEPQSKLLQTIAKRPLSRHVRMHSLIGNRCGLILHRHSDGVVPVASARESRAITERTVKTIHTRLNRHPDTIREVTCILRAHLDESSSVQTREAHPIATVESNAMSLPMPTNNPNPIEATSSGEPTSSG